jgi:hypothetical protein
MDSSWYPPANPWKWTDPEANTLIPEWDGPHCFEVFDPSDTLVDLIITPDSLHFAGIEGEASPPAQSFDIETDGYDVYYNLTEDISWITATPLVAQTPQTVNVACNTVGLAAGEYLDTIMIEATGAENSPQYVVVTLSLEPPPPTIDYSPDAFYFNAIAGEPNPAPQTLSIYNTGGGELDWTVTNSESWLWADPASGFGDADIDISVDITGLPYGQYYDTLVISDPAATNDPRRVPVYLSVASDLPVIEVDSAYNTIIVDVPSNDIPPRTISILNGGGGSMNYWLEENSVRLWTYEPSSGTVPQDVVVDFKLAGGTAGEDYYDTLWVHSNEAINSPFPVVFYLHYVAEPAVVTVSDDTLHFTSYECGMGLDGVPSPQQFLVNNVGGDNPMPINLLYETNMFYINQDTATAPFLFSMTANYNLELPLGTYYDTILVSGPNAINSPETLIVALHRVEGDQDPEMVMPFTSYTFYTQYQSGYEPFKRMFVQNQHGGCMPWEVQNQAAWVYPTPDAGDIPGLVQLSVNSEGFPFGHYVDTFQVVAPTATNSPKDVTVEMWVWLLHGDNNYDGIIDIRDLVYLINYMFKEGPEPMPEYVVGDLNCDLEINIQDLTYFIDYMFHGGPIPCGNPY